MSEQAPAITIHYMKGYGRAEPIRFLLSHAGIPYTDAYYTYQTSFIFFLMQIQMAELNATGKLEFGQVPVVEKDGKCMAQTFATLRYLAKEYGYYSDNAYEAYLIDSTADAVGDVFIKVLGSIEYEIKFNFTGYFMSAFAPQAAQKELFDKFYQQTLPRFFSAFEKRLETNQSGFFVGEKLTMADFMMGSMILISIFVIFSLYFNEACQVQQPILEIAKGYPKLMAYSEGLKEHLKARLSNRIVSPW